MKKFFISGIFVLVFGAYALYQYVGTASSVSYIAQNAPVSLKQPVNGGVLAQATPPKQYPVQSRPSPKTPAPAPTPTPAPTPAPAPKPKGQYIDGTYIGSAADAYYGLVQVQVAVSGGKITDVQFLQYPNDRNTSRYINSQAMPILMSEAIDAQSAQVDGVSGASDTSAAFRESLSSALSQAKS